MNSSHKTGYATCEPGHPGIIQWSILAALALTFLAAAPVSAAGYEYGYADRAGSDRIQYQHPYGPGEFVRYGFGHWLERNPDGTFSFEERYRQQGLIQLYDASRDTWIILNLPTRSIHVSQRGGAFGYLYPIIETDALPRNRLHRHGQGLPNGHGYREWPRADSRPFDSVHYRHPYGPGEFIRVAPNLWIERNPDGVFRFEERGRDRYGVELYDRTRDTWVSIDRRRGSIDVRQSGTPYQVLYSAVRID